MNLNGGSDSQVVMSCAALLGSLGRKNVTAHVKSSLPSTCSGLFFITTSSQETLCIPKLTTGSSSSMMIFQIALAHLIYQYQFNKHLSHLELSVPLPVSNRFTLKAFSPTVDLV